MTFSVKNKVVSLGGSSFVLDDNGEKIFRINGRVLSPTHKKIVCGADGQKLFVVRNKFWHFFRKSAFVYNADGEKLLKITKKFWTNNFLVENYDSEIEIDGNWIGWNLEVLKEGQLVGRINKNITIVRDSFRVETTADEHNALLTAIVVAIDNIFDASKSRT